MVNHEAQGKKYIVYLIIINACMQDTPSLYVYAEVRRRRFNTITL